MTANRTVSFAVALCAAASAAFGADVCCVKADPRTDGKVQELGDDFSSASVWADNTAASPENDYWMIYGQSINSKATATASASETFAGATLNLGAPSTSEWGAQEGGISSRTRTPATLTTPNLVWWSGPVFTRYGGTHLLHGTWTVRQADTAAYHHIGLNAASHLYTNFVTVVSADDDGNAAKAVISLTKGWDQKYPGSITATTMAGGTQGIHHWRGDASGYKGSWNVDAPYQPFVLWNGTIIGDPATPNAAAIRLNTNAAIAFGADFAQNTSRGIEIYGTQAYFMTYAAFANTYTVRYPVSGKGKFIKSGPGTVTLACVYTGGGIDVSQGTLILAPEATFPAGQAVTVRKGATLVINRADAWDAAAFTVTVESGGTVTRRVTVIYDAATDAVSAPAVLAADAAPNAGETKIALALSSAIALPFHTAKRLAVATLAAGASFTADDFTDATAKTYGLPKTSFEIDGQTLYLVARPVAVSVRDFDNANTTINGANSGVTTAYWSNGATAQAGFDYLLTNTAERIGTAAFAGASLTIAGGKNVDSKHAESRLTATTLYPPVTIRANNGSYPVHKLAGDIAVAGVYGGSVAAFRGVVGTGSNSTKVAEGLDVTADLTGDGVVQLRGANVTAGTHRMGLHGDNTGFVGQFVVGTETGGTVDNRKITTRLRFSAAKNLGGEPDVFRYNAVKTQQNSFLQPDTTMTFAAVNRGIDISSGGFDVPDGVTFTVKAPIRQESQAYKLGGGVLALGGTICWGSDGSVSKASSASYRTVVEEGGLSAASDDGVKNMYLVFSNDTAIVLSPAANLTDGLTGTVAVPEGRVRVVLDAAYAHGEKPLAVPICTVADDALADKFTLVRADGYSAALVTEAVTLDGAACTRYTVRYRPEGLTILFR